MNKINLKSLEKLFKSENEPLSYKDLSGLVHVGSLARGFSTLLFNSSAVGKKEVNEAIYVPTITFSHELWLVADRMRSQISEKSCCFSVLLNIAC